MQCSKYLPKGLQRCSQHLFIINSSINNKYWCLQQVDLVGAPQFHSALGLASFIAGLGVIAGPPIAGNESNHLFFPLKENFTLPKTSLRAKMSGTLHYIAFFLKTANFYSVAISTKRL